jgi:hypothetical protein
MGHATAHAAAWDARVARLLATLPRPVRSAVAWLRHPARRWPRLTVAALLVVGGVLAILPVFGMWMLPLGLALAGEDLPWMKPPLERAACRIERAWARLRGY